MYTIHIDRERHWQQFGTTLILISAPTGTVMHQRGFTVLGKKPSVKADLAIYSHVVDASGQCMSVSLILGFKLDLSSCANWYSFCKSSHKIRITLNNHVLSNFNPSTN